MSVEIPRATYRLQLHAEFGFEAAAALAPYLAALGVSHVYCSPYLKARPGSLHGYDITDHGRLNPEIGADADYEHFVEALTRHGLGQLLDVVPNHMAVLGGRNQWWQDVLENGPASEYAEFFDVDWQPLKEELRGRVLLPVLGDHYGNVLDRGELELEVDGGAFAVRYFEHRFPIDPRTYGLILAPDLEALRRGLDADDERLLRFESLLSAFGKLPSRYVHDETALVERRRDSALYTARLASLAEESGAIAAYLERCLRRVNADTDRLHALLEAQAYRLAYWRVAGESINYRRFFDVNDLASLRMENPAVFEATHGFVLELIGRGVLAGLRIDHPDGLYDPAGYFRRLQQAIAAVLGRSAADGRVFYVLAEKILGHGETLRPDWPIHGATGYEFSNLVTRLFVDPQGVEPLQQIYARFVHDNQDYREVLHRSKRLIMQTSLASELNVLATELERMAELDPHTRDFGLWGLRNALLETIAYFPVYRTYVVGQRIGEVDRKYLEQAVLVAKRRSEAADTSVFDFLREVLLLRAGADKGERYRARLVSFVMRMQQYTAPVAAKGMEDTAFYRYNWLVSLNDVGGTPEAPSVSLGEFHEANRARYAAWKHEMLSTSTHDSKRSEDVRARISVLSELPQEWERHLSLWADCNDDLKREVEGLRVPDRPVESLFYQTLIGAWPLGMSAPDEAFRCRIGDYLIKAAREAKVHTSWINPHPEYEQALTAFAEGVLSRRLFLEQFLPWQARLARLGLWNSLAQTLLKLTCPGVPDIYQGNESWVFDLVDPDNRRPVDFDHRRALLAELEPLLAAPERRRIRELAAQPEDGRIKLYLTARTLRLRRDRARLFSEGDYLALQAAGPEGDSICAFVRETRETRMVVAALRGFASLCTEPEAQDASPFALDSGTRLAFGSDRARYRNVLDGSEVAASGARGVPARELFAVLPVALLVPVTL